MKAIGYAISELENLKDQYEFISERLIKFPFFGHMISGTPDLLLKPNGEGIFKIVDFKTGKKKKDAEAYWFQLNSYALASYELNYLSKESSLELILMYLDEQQKFIKKVGYQEVKNDLFNYWLKLDCLDQVNESHCSVCSFGNLCQR